MLPRTAYMTIGEGAPACRVLHGMWQVSGAHGTIDPGKAIEAMLRAHDAGFTTWDLADHYGPAEDFIGSFRDRLTARDEPGALDTVRAFTKWVPRPGPMPRHVVERAVDVSLQRMHVPSLDMLQFHWWDYHNPAYLDALDVLATLRAEGKIANVALTNFDTTRLVEILDAGIPVVSNQVQYSIIDQRPGARMAPACTRRGVGLLAYGTLAGGFFSNRYLGAPEPRRGQLETASQGKYKQMIDAWGGWTLFQELLVVLDGIARKHGASIANVATRYILDKPAVSGVITGARLGVSEHLDDTTRVFSLELDDDDRASIDAFASKARDLLDVIGDCGDEYR